MGFCKFCKEIIEQPAGKRKKEFCNNTCRSNYWYKKNKKGKGADKKSTEATKKPFEPTCYTPEMQAALDEANEILKPPIDKEEIYRQISAIRNEEIPPERNTSLGRLSWKKEQEKRIEELQKQIR